VPDHPSVLRRWRAALAGGGQLAVQVPANADHASHRVARRLARERWGENAPPDPVDSNVLAPERYAELLDALDADQQHVRLQVYGHRLPTSAAVVEWVKGTSLTRFKQLPGFDAFLEDYRQQLVAELGEGAPYFYPFKRILLWGRFDR
jgi:trans-aconitate 2-methyltransferase